MTSRLGESSGSEHRSTLSDGFTQSLSRQLETADRARRAQLLRSKLRVVLLAVLTVGPLIGWHLTATGPDDVHLTIDVLAWLTFILNVGVRIDSAILSYLHLQALPSVAGIALMVLVTAGLLLNTGNEK